MCSDSFRRNEAGPRGSHYAVQRDTSLVVCEEEQEVKGNKLSGQHSHPASHAASVYSAAVPSGLSQEKQKCIQLWKKKATCAPGLVFAPCWEPSASPVLCLAGGSTRSPVPSSSSCLLCLELLREALLISNTLTQFNVGSPGCRICRRALSSQPSWGCRREPGQSNALSALTVARKFGNDRWAAGNQ